MSLPAHDHPRPPTNMSVFALEHGYEHYGATNADSEQTAYGHGLGTLAYRPHQSNTNARWKSVKVEPDVVLAKTASLKLEATSGFDLDDSLRCAPLPSVPSAVPRSSLSFILNPSTEQPTSLIEATTDINIRRESDAGSTSEGSSTTSKCSTRKRGRAQSDEHTSTRSKGAARELKRQKESNARENHAKLYGGLEKVLMGDFGVVYERAGYNAMNSHNQGKKNLMVYSKEGTLVCTTTKLKELAAFLPLMNELALCSTQLQQALHALQRDPRRNSRALDAITRSFDVAQQTYEDHLQRFDPKGELDIARAKDLRDHFQSLAQSLRLIQDG